MEKIKLTSYNVIFILFLLISSNFMNSCKSEENDIPENIETFESLEINYRGTDFDFNTVTVLNRNEIDLEQLLDEIAEEIYEYNFESTESSETNKMAYVIVDISIGEETITLTPSIGTETPEENGNCGTGSGWKDYGVCYSKTCVAEKSKKAALEMSADLGTGQCLDVRVKRNLTNARVCARVVNC